MSEKKFQQQRNDKKHRKLIRSPENLSPCDLEPSFNPLSKSNNKSSPTKNYNDQFPPHQQQVWQSSNFTTNVDHPIASCSSFLPPSSSTPSMLYRKPSITIKYSKDEGHKAELFSGYQSSLAYHQNISKSIDSNHHPFSKIISTTENADQTSNNFSINVNSKVPACCLQNSAQFLPSKHKEPLEKQSKNVSLFSFSDEFKSSSLTLTSDICQMQQLQQQQQIFTHSPTSQSLNLNLVNQSNIELNISDRATCGQMIFNSNNPFLNDTFDAITTHEDEGGGKLDENIFNQTRGTFLRDEMAINDSDLMEDQLLKNKREKFSNASTMKICLVVSPPTNKLFQVSR